MSARSISQNTPADEPTVLLADAVCDPWGATFAPGAMVVAGGEVVAWGEASTLRREYGGARCVDLADRFGPVLALPGMVNAHAHLDLAHTGPRPHRGAFLDWVRGEVLPARALGDQVAAASVTAAARASLAAGVEAIGDVVGTVAAREALEGSGLLGTSFEELFGLRTVAVQTLQKRVDAIAREAAGQPADAGVRRGLQPHAPYSVSSAGYAACTASGLPLCTHLAELAEEAELVARGTGPMRDMLEATGLWAPELEAVYGGGLSPVAWLRPALEAAAGRFVVAHVNHLDDADIATLAETATSVAYCPVASAYFGHTGHRVADLLAAGVNVALGTDSALCQPPGEAQPHGVLAQARWLFRRGTLPAATLLRMAVANGHRALGRAVRSRRLGLVSIAAGAADPLGEALSGTAPLRGWAAGALCSAPTRG